MCDSYKHLFWQHTWVWLLWLFSQLWITLHIWKPNVARLMPTEVLFTMPMYESMFVDQSLALNRRHDKVRRVLTDVKKKVSFVYIFGLKEKAEKSIF
jgi:hypothetical protein